MAKPVKVSMTTFVDFVTASGTSRIAKISAARRSYDQPFTPAREYWLPLRQAIVSMHEQQLGIGSLQTSVRSQTDAKKIANYESRLKGYERFVGKKVYEWFSPPSASWTSGSLTVGVSPELGLVIKNEPHVVKLHLKADELSKQRCDVLLHLMDVTVGSSGRVAILDIERAKLHVQTRVINGIDALLRAEAGAFVEMWNDLG